MSDGVKISRVQRMRVAEEPNGSFAVNIAAGSMTDIPFIEGSAAITTTVAQLPTQTTQQHIDGYDRNVLGLRSATLNFSMLLAPTGSAAGSATAAKGSSDGVALGLLLKAIMGTETIATGDTSASGSSATAVNVTTASRWVPGYAMGWVNTAGVYEVRPIVSESSSTETMALGFSGSPANSDVLYNGTHYTLSIDPNTSLQFIVEGEEDDDYWRLSGCQGSIALELTLGELPKVTFSITAANWTHLGDRGGDIGASTHLFHTPVHFADSTLLQWTNGTATYSATTSPVHASAVSMSPTIAYIPVRTPGGTQTIYRWRRNRTAPMMTIQFTTWFEGYAGNANTGNQDGWGSMRDARTAKGFALQIGSTAGSTIFIHAPRCQITDVQRVDDGGIAGQQVTAIVLNDSVTTSGNASAFHISLM